MSSSEGFVLVFGAIASLAADHGGIAAARAPGLRHLHRPVVHRGEAPGSCGCGVAGAGPRVCFGLSLGYTGTGGPSTGLPM